MLAPAWKVPLWSVPVEEIFKYISRLKQNYNMNFSDNNCMIRLIFQKSNWATNFYSHIEYIYFKSILPPCRKALEWGSTCVQQTYSQSPYDLVFWVFCIFWRFTFSLELAKESKSCCDTTLPNFIFLWTLLHHFPFSLATWLKWYEFLFLVF